MFSSLLASALDASVFANDIECLLDVTGAI